MDASKFSTWEKEKEHKCSAFSGKAQSIANSSNNTYECITSRRCKEDFETEDY